MNLEEFIRSTGETHFHLLLNEGNAGDGLIHAGVHRFIARLGLTVEKIDLPQDVTGKFLLIVGAGAFCASSAHMVEAVNFYSPRFERVCILPSTFDTKASSVSAMLRKLAPNVTLFCRERISLDAVGKLVPAPEKLLIDHDMAFEMDATAWKRPGTGTLDAFRTDGESLLRRVPFRNYDISLMGREFQQTLLLDIVANFETIYTDRLHVGISGALLGKDVHLFEGNYHKIRGIYDYSLKDRYPNVTLCGTEELRKHLAESDRQALKHRVFQTVVALPYGQQLVSAVKKHTRTTKLATEKVAAEKLPSNEPSQR